MTVTKNEPQWLGSSIGACCLQLDLEPAYGSALEARQTGARGCARLFDGTAGSQSTAGTEIQKWPSRGSDARIARKTRWRRMDIREKP